MTRSQLSMITARAQRVWRVTFDAQQDFSTHDASRSCAVEPPTSRVVRRRPTWPSASRVRAGSAWSGWARWDRQRTMYTRASPAAHPEPSESGALPLTSASSRGRQSVNARAAVISTDRQTDALSDSIFWLSLNGTLGPKKAREGLDCTARSRRGKGVKVVVRSFVGVRGGEMAALSEWRTPPRRRPSSTGADSRDEHGCRRTAGAVGKATARQSQLSVERQRSAALPPSQWPAGRRAVAGSQWRARGEVDEAPELSPTSRPSSGAAFDSFCTYVWGASSRSSSADAKVPLQHRDRHRPAFQGERGPSNQLAQAKQPRKAFEPALRLSMRCIPSRLLTRRVRPFAGVSIWVDRTSQGGWHCVTPGSS